jgi:hypothetical protein
MNDESRVRLVPKCPTVKFQPSRFGINLMRGATSWQFGARRGWLVFITGNILGLSHVQAVAPPDAQSPSLTFGLSYGLSHGSRVTVTPINGSQAMLYLRDRPLWCLDGCEPRAKAAMEPQSRLRLTALFDKWPSRLLWMNVLPSSAPDWVGSQPPSSRHRGLPSFQHMLFMSTRFEGSCAQHLDIECTPSNRI